MEQRKGGIFSSFGLKVLQTPSNFCPPSGEALPNCSATNGQLPVKGKDKVS